MILTIVHSWKKLAAPVAFLAFFLLVGVGQASAQSFKAQSLANPETSLAQKFGVTARPIGTWSPNNVVQILTANRPNVRSQNVTLTNKVTFTYYQMVISDITNYSIAPEIALLTNLEKVQQQFKTSASVENTSFLTNLYNSAVALF